MTWRLKGTYVASCACEQICPCAFDGKPQTESGECDGGLVYHIDKGDLDGVSLSGLNVGFFIHLPSNFSSGNLKVAIVVDESASEEQAKAIERILTGQEGGTFGEFVPLISEFTQTQRAKVTFSGGDKPTASIGSVKLTFEPYLGPDGTPATIRNAPFGFAPEFKIGKGSGTGKSPFASYTQRYAEVAEFDYSDTPVAGAAKGRV